MTAEKSPSMETVNKQPRIIIMAAGKAKRWTGEWPKHLTEIGGEPILYRTVRLLAEVGATDMFITVSRELYAAMDCSRITQADLYIPDKNVQEIDRFLSCRDLWTRDTIFLYGDAYYTETAIKQILWNNTPPVTFYGRKRGNEVKPYGEMFAIRANALDEVFLLKLATIRGLEIAGTRRGLGWDVYRAYGKTNFVELDPLVEDFDKLEDVARFKQVHALV